MEKAKNKPGKPAAVLEPPQPEEPKDESAAQPDGPLKSEDWNSGVPPEQKVALETASRYIDLDVAKQDSASLTHKAQAIKAVALVPLICPECQILMEGHSQTGQRPITYFHPFSQSNWIPKVDQAGNPIVCSLRGKKFKAPTVDLEIIEKPVERPGLPRI